MLGPGPRLIKKNLQGRGLTKIEKHCFTSLARYCIISCLRKLVTRAAVFVTESEIGYKYLDDFLLKTEEIV